ncbi:MAG: N-formylglutamate amidohydrolase [Erythrobacter sp.]|nr:N-formylglutamate amidohydrolase [Erythrobacter sp.]
MDGPAFTLEIVEQQALPVIIAAPHGGRAYSDDILANFRDPDSRLRLEDRHVDGLARSIAKETGASFLVAHAPRAVIDLNRAPDDVDWTMVRGTKANKVRHSLANRRARSGLGLVPRRLPGLGEIWKRPLERTDLDERIETIHRPYHQALGKTLEQLRDHWGAALLIDLHSMPPLRQRHPEEVAAEFVIGDRFGSSCDTRLVACALNHFGEAERPVAHNRPYSGGYVLDRHGAPLRGIHAMQVEVCRATYLDARLESESARQPAIAKLLSGLVRKLASEVAEIGSRGQLPQAAE